MTSISTVGHADVAAVPKAKSRNLSLDRARTFLTLVVLTHHAVIPYTYFGPDWSPGPVSPGRER